MSKQSSPTHLAPLTGLRFFAALSIIIFHYGQFSLSTWPEAIRNAAAHMSICVSLFFVLSGFILTHTYLNSHGHLKSTISHYLMARFARIVPVYILAFVMVAPFVAKLFLDRHSGQIIPAAADLTTQAAMTLSFTQAWFGDRAIIWNGPVWSVSTEMFFYLTFPWFATWIYTKKPNFSIILAILLWSVSLLPFILHHLPIGVGFRNEITRAAYFFPPLRLPEFLIGVLCARFYRSLEKNSLVAQHQKLIGSCCSSTAIIALGAIMTLIPAVDTSLNPAVFPFFNGLLSPLFGILIIGLALGGGPLAYILSWRSFMLLGAASYSLYILHMALSPWFVFAFPDLMTPGALKTPPTIFWPVAMMWVAISVLVYLLLEQPASRYLRKPEVWQRMAALGPKLIGRR